MNTTPSLIEDTNLSNAWCQVLERIINNTGNEITPLILTLTGFEEQSETRKVLDSYLEKSQYNSIDTVSETIFPESLYMLSDYDRDKFYNSYTEILPRIKKIDSNNSRGTYFERLIAYDDGDKKINQLEIIIKSLKDNKVKRRSKLQASIFDPGKDHIENAYQGFPCLQHISIYKSENGGIILNSFYAIQYTYKKAYGNWLGLINLGKFIARELGLKLERFNCFVGVEKLQGLTKTEAKQLLLDIKN